MRKSFLLSAMLCAAMCFSAAAFAKDDAPKPKAKAEPANTKCPITGDDVDASVPTMKFKGKTVGFCCKDCPAKFKALKAPEKDEKMKVVLADDSKSSDDKKTDDKKTDDKKMDDKKAKGDKLTAGKPVNANCLVHTENAIDSTVTQTYKGKTYGFCCEDCIKKFNSDPDSFAKATK